MVSLSAQATIPSPLEEVWPLLSDPALVAACIPGATLAPAQDDGLWRGTIRVKFGPTVAVFRGEASLTYDHTARRCTIEGRGIDQRGASRALASGVVTASGADKTTLAVDGNFTVTGPLETFANAGGVHVARALLAEFSANMAKVVAERRSAAGAARTSPPAGRSAAPATASSASPAARAAQQPSQPLPQPAVASELSGGRLLWCAFLSWLGALFGKRNA